MALTIPAEFQLARLDTDPIRRFVGNIADVPENTVGTTINTAVFSPSTELAAQAKEAGKAVLAGKGVGTFS